MNVLILSDKSDIKTYTALLKAAPNTSVLGAVSKITPNLLGEIKSKWHPHIILIDTSISVKKDMLIRDFIENIAFEYPYIKLIVITDEADFYKYPAFKTIRNEISNLEFNEIIAKASEEVTIINSKSEPSEDTNNEITEKLPANTAMQNKVDNLSTSDFDIKDDNMPKTRIKIKKQNKNIFPIVIVAVVSALAVIIIGAVVIGISLKIDNNVAAETTDQVVSKPSSYVQKEETTIFSLFESSSVQPSSEVSIPTSAYIAINEDITSIQNSTEKVESTTSNQSSASSKSSGKESSSNTTQSSSTSRTVSKSNSPSSSNGSSLSSSSAATKKSTEVTSIILSKTYLSLTEGDNYTLTAEVYPSNAEKSSVIWTSSNTAVVTVNNGNLTAKGAGSATVTTKSSNGIKASCTVQVKAVATESTERNLTTNIYITPSVKTISVGETVTITIIGVNECSWEISNPFVVNKVSSTSCSITVKGSKEGITNIIAVTSDGKSFKSKITVS